MQNIVCSTLLIEKSPQALPLGIACIASALKSSDKITKNFSIIFTNFSFEDKEILNICKNINPGEVKNAKDIQTGKFIAEKIISASPKFVFFSVYMWNHIALESAAKQIKKILPKTIIVAGGPEVTANPFAFENFDFCIAGNGEEASTNFILKYLNSSLNKNDFFNKELDNFAENLNISGIYYKNPKTKIFNSRASVCDLQVLSSPYLDGTLNPADYEGALWELARGCPFKCSYCYESKGEKKVSYFPLSRIEKELDLFAQKKVPQIFVLDPTYNANKERAIKMLKMIAQKTPDTFYYFEARAEFIDREMAHAFSQICCALQIGLQSSDSEVLKNVNRTLDKKKFCRNIGFLNEEGVTFGFDLIYGLPGDSFKGFKNSIDFALSLYPNNLELFCLSVLPGTDLSEKAESFNLEWEKQPPYKVLNSPTFSAKDLQKASKLARATNIFYTQGRAVSWFNCVLYHLNTKASNFLSDFEKFLEDKKIAVYSNPSTQEIRKWQLDFMEIEFAKKGLQKYFALLKDIVTLYGALSDADGEAKTSEVQLSYNADDLLSEYAMDFPFFIQNAKKQNNKITVFPTPNGADFK